MARALLVLLLLTSTVHASPVAPPKKYEVRVTEETRQLARIRHAIYFGGSLYWAAAVLLILASGLSARLRDFATRSVRRPFAATMLYAALGVAVLTLLQFPLSFYAGYVVPHQFDLSSESFGSWLLDEAKSLGVLMVIGAIVGALVLLPLQRVKRWWLPMWLGSIPLTVLLVVIAPVFIDPLFNDFVPLRDQALKQRLLDMAERAGIEGGRVYQVDKSRQTKTLNAYVTGIGPTKRIVLWDTLIAAMTQDEIVTVMAHEMGHYVLHHLWLGLAFSLLVSLVIFRLSQPIYERAMRRWGERWRLGASGDMASLPLLLLIGSSIAFLLTPAIAAHSRMSERAADEFALRLTHLNEPMASAFVKLGENAKADPHPHPAIVFWRYTHPPIGERIEWALAWRPPDAQSQRDATSRGSSRASVPNGAR
ncbi:MAG TPA: M48 family metallopeptidase [Thermoanaerobaculia bacterium]|jgi:Zn-dependent protease with chaperone function